MITRRKSILIFYIMTLLFSACADKVPKNTPIVDEAEIEEEYGWVDGEATANVFTWEDINENGIFDDGEPPIPFVTTSIFYPDFLTGSDGWGSPWMFMPGCAQDCWKGEQVMIKVPPGFKATTPTTYPLTGEEDNYYFGFTRENEERNFSFVKEPDWKESFINRGANVLAFHYSDSGLLEITLDKNNTIIDDYYPDGQIEDRLYFDTYLFDIILELNRYHEIEISEVKITLMPSNSIFMCKIEKVNEWTGILSGYEILIQKCEHQNG